MIVLDTHVWVWWMSDRTQLSKRAQKAVEEHKEFGKIVISSISTWEVAMLVLRKRLKLTMDVEDWLSRAEAIPFLNFVPVDNYIALKATQLNSDLHKDPADRIIIATAIVLGASLVTKDRRIRNFRKIKTIW